MLDLLPTPLPSCNLTQALISRLTSEITSGRFGPGDRLPTEQQITAATGVSRTVVREAVAALKGLGLVETKRELAPSSRAFPGTVLLNSTPHGFSCFPTCWTFWNCGSASK
jgi:DNA-binding transcriptional MocR family regulator